MVKRTDIHPAKELERLNAQDAAAVINHAFSSGNSRTKESFFSDDLIVSLSDAYENRRARQVTEWERRQHVTSAF